MIHLLISEPLSCGSPDSLQNTTVSGKNFTNGANISYSCPIGHALIGNETRTCENGIWSGKAPTCKCMLKFNLEQIMELKYFIIFLISYLS